MTRVVVPRGSASAGSSSSSSNDTNKLNSVQYEDLPLEVVQTGRSEDVCVSNSDKNELHSAGVSEEEIITRIAGVRVIDEGEEENDVSKSDDYALQPIGGGSHPPPPPAPPTKPLTNLNSRRSVGSFGRAHAWPVVSIRTSPTGSSPPSPRFHGENEGYNSADEQSPCYGSSYDNAERDHQFEIDIKRIKGFEVKKMLQDGNCLFRAVADQVYGDSEGYDLARQMCLDYMEHERDHFSQFITEDFTSYCKRKRRDKVYGNNVEIQAFAEMYNRPIHIYSYSTDPINIFHGSYNIDTPPIRLSYHHGNHYNSLVDPHRLTIGAGLGFSALKGALVAEARFYSDIELTEKEMEYMVIEASKAEYVANNRFKHQLVLREPSSSSAEPSSSGARADTRKEHEKGLISSIQMLLSMGFSYVQAIEAYSIFGVDVDSMVCYLLETSSRRKGKASTH